MKIKSYSAPTLQEALLKVRSEIGPSALILETRKYTGDGANGPMGKGMIEVIAAAPSEISETTPSPSLQKNVAIKGEDNDGASQAGLLMANQRIKANAKWAEALQSVEPALEKTQAKPLETKDSLREPPRARTDGWTETIRELYATLRAQDVDETLSKTLLDNVKNGLQEDDQINPDTIKQHLKARITEAVPTKKSPANDAKAQKVIAFIGPTGVGKTTTIAKLAAKYSMKTGEDVALITVDTYRIGGAEQLKTYGDIMGIPVSVVFTPQELKNAVDQSADSSIIFIDTAGRSQFDAASIRALKGILHAVPQVETHLVVSATTRYSDAIEIFNRFGVVPIHNIVFTKIDETRSYGMLLDLTARTTLPPSYLTNGQEVPDDIEEAVPDRIAELIVDGV